MRRSYLIVGISELRSALQVHFRAVLILIVFLSGGKLIEAEPVTFRFDGVVTSIERSPTGSFDLPFDLAVGSQMNGTMRFEPIAFGENGLATSVQFALSSELFLGSDIPLRTFNDYLPPATGLVDAISVDCGATLTCTEVVSSAPEVAVDQMGMSFSSTDVAGFVAGEDLGNVGFWNRFVPLSEGGIGFSVTRTFYLELYSSADASNGTIGIRGTLGPLEVVPEPSMAFATIVALACILFTFRRKP